jgi:nucleotide-binding universal stress UspA family protein
LGIEFHRILVPVTGERIDEETVELACGLANNGKAMVWVLYVIQVARSLPLDAEIPAETARGEQVLQRIEEIGRHHKCKVEGQIIQAREIGPAVLQEVADHQVELLMVGLPEQRRYGIATLGDMVLYVLKYAPCQVLVNRERLMMGATEAGPD